MRSSCGKASRFHADPPALRRLRRSDDWPNLDRPDRSRGDLGGLGDGLLLVLGLNDVEADDLVAPGGGGAWGGLGASAADAGRRCRLLPLVPVRSLEKSLSSKPLLIPCQSNLVFVQIAAMPR